MCSGLIRSNASMLEWLISRRGIDLAALQAPRSGRRIKFYGVAGSGFFQWFYSGENRKYPFDFAGLEHWPVELPPLRASIFSAVDVIVFSSGERTLIDLNEATFAPVGSELLCHSDFITRRAQVRETQPRFGHGQSAFDEEHQFIARDCSRSHCYRTGDRARDGATLIDPTDRRIGSNAGVSVASLGPRSSTLSCSVPKNSRPCLSAVSLHSHALNSLG